MLVSMNNILVTQQVSTFNEDFVLTVFEDKTMLTLTINDKGEFTDYWDNSTFISDMLYPQLRQYLVSNVELDFDGGVMLKTNYSRNRLFELYEILVAADALGWMLASKDFERVHTGK